jgi:DNA repair protein RAD50
MERLQADFAERQRNLDTKIQEAQNALQELNRSVDNFEDANKAIERCARVTMPHLWVDYSHLMTNCRYVREKGAKKLRDCEERLVEYEEQVKKLSEDAEKARERQVVLAKEISDSNATIAGLRENVRIRKLERDIKETQAAIESYDVEEAARSRRIFEERYVAEKKRETDIQSAVCFPTLSNLTNVSNPFFTSYLGLEESLVHIRINSKNAKEI